MDQAVVKFYRNLIKTSFDYAGSLDNPSILLDSVSEGINLCGQAAGNSLHLYVNIKDGVIDDIKYLCTCDPTVNVVIEILCALVKGKTLAEVKNITEEAFARAAGCRDEEFLEKARQAMAFLNKGIAKFELEAA